jgi:hypothetical protein
MTRAFSFILAIAIMMTGFVRQPARAVAAGLRLPVYVPPLPLGLVDVPPGLDPSAAREFLQALQRAQAQPLLDALNVAQAAGWVDAYALDLEQGQIMVSVPGPAEAARLQAELTGKAAPAQCAAGEIDARLDEVVALSQRVSGSSAPPERPLAAEGPAATNPSIRIQLTPDSDYTDFDGAAAGATSVTWRIVRVGAVVAAGSAPVSGGLYHVRAPVRACDLTYEWRIAPGDVVEVTANGVTVQTTAVALDAVADPVAKSVSGTTAPGRTVRVEVTGQPAIPASLNAAGAFSVAPGDFNRRAVATITASDANQNSTYAVFQAYRLSTSLTSSYVSATIRPNVNYTLTLQRGTTTLSTITGRTDRRGAILDNLGRVGAFLTVFPVAGDVLRVTDGAVSVQMTLSALTATFSAGPANQITGVASAGWTLESTITQRATIRCSAVSETIRSQVPDGGLFSLSSALTVGRGDIADHVLFDPEGNQQAGPSSVIPFLRATWTTRSLGGAWGQGGVPVTLELRDSANTLKTAQVITTTGTLGEFNYTVPGGVSLEAGDQILVGHGTLTLTIGALPLLDVRLNANTANASGAAPVSGATVTYSDVDTALAELPTRSACAGAAAPSGLYSVPAAALGVVISGGDSATVYASTSEGHLVIATARAFQVNVDANGVRGNSGLSQVSTVSVDVAGGGPVPVTTSADGAFAYTTPLANGNSVFVSTAGGESTWITYSDLSLTRDAAANAVTGVAPAAGVVRATLNRIGLNATRNAATGPGNAFSVGFAGVLTQGCVAAAAGQACTYALADFVYPAGHTVTARQAPPAVIGPDAYETGAGDNTRLSAAPYFAPQSHTVHASSDVDWVRFEVPAENVGLGYVFRFTNQGLGFIPTMRVYGAGPQALYTGVRFDLPTTDTVFSFVPSSAGTHYLEIRSSVANCESNYTLDIRPVRYVYLPALTR